MDRIRAWPTALEPVTVNARGLPQASWIDHPSGFLALSVRNRRFELPGRPGFVAYREQGRHLVAFGGVHAPESERARLLNAFLAEAARQQKVALFVQIREEAVPLFLDHGMTVNQFGTSITLELAGYNLTGSEKMRLRNKINRAHKAGIRVLEIGTDVPSGEAVFAQLRTITAGWLAGKKKQELDFMIGELGAPGDPHRRIFVALDKKGAHVGFITYVPAWGRMPGYLHDLARRLPDAPAGTMEAVNALALQKLMREGVRFLHFGFTPFILFGEEYPGFSRAMAWLGRILRRNGQALYPADSQAAYKLKWGPRILEREFIAARPLALRAAYDLLRLTRSL